MNKISEVCLIDDDKIQIFLMEKFLSKTGDVQNITAYDNGKSAFEEMRKRTLANSPLPNLIFLDINMPIWDGWVFYEEFKKLPGFELARVYILTSSLSEEDVDRAKSLGLADHYLCKPLDYVNLKTITSAF